MIQSAENITTHTRRQHNIGPGAGQTYGIDYDRKDNSTDMPPWYGGSTLENSPPDPHLLLGKDPT